jgi:hypothetical protein
VLTDALLEETLVDGPKGKPVDGLSLECGVCGECVECAGQDTPENRSCLKDKLNAICPERRKHIFKLTVG